MAVRFYIENKKYIYVSYHAPDGRVKMSIQETLDKELFDKGTLPKVISKKIERIRLAVEDYVDQSKLAAVRITKQGVTDAINYILDKRERSARFGEKFTEYIDFMNKGKLLNKGKKYSDSTIKMHNAIGEWLAVMPKLAGKDLNDITLRDFDTMKQDLIARNKSQNTMSVYILYIKTFLKRTHKMKWHTNTVFMDDEIRMPPDTIDTQSYLNETEIKKLLDLKDLSPTLAVMRDCFVFGCYIGQRYSDLVRIRAANVKGNVIILQSKKTAGKNIHIPLNAVAREILERYPDGFKEEMGTTAVNRIHAICKLAGIDDKILIARTIGGKRVTWHVPKYDTIGTHTMRRSFATNAYKAGVPAISIMKITGHIEESSFLKYIRISNEENAELMAEHAFFR